VTRRFRHYGQDWEAQPLGAGVGAGFGNQPPAINIWGVAFKSLSSPTREPHVGSIPKPDVNQLTEQELQASLDQALANAVFKALQDPQWDWRTVDGLAQEVGLPEDVVLQIIESAPDRVIRSRVPDARGRALYTTRSHYRERRGFWESFRST